MALYSPLRYPGSKRKLVKYINRVLGLNNYTPDILVEPFMGGGSVSLDFILNNRVKKIIIADKDKLIYSFWKIVFNNPNYLINFIKRVEVNLNNFYKYKKIAENSKKYNEKRLAQACLFLNRTSFSGILKNNVGPLGGKKQKSPYKISCRFNKERLIDQIKKISKHNKKVIVLNNDWKETLVFAEKFKKKQKRLNKILYYFDPPFYRKAKDLYRHCFDEQEHKKLCKKVTSLGRNWILSYDRAPEVREMYKKFIRRDYAFPYSVNSPARRIEKEFFITPFKKPSKKDLEKQIRKKLN